MNEKKDVKFDKRAELYDDGFEGKFSEKFYDLVTENVELRAGFNVLDAGCGTGTILKRLSKKENINCFGIDVEKEMLSVAIKKCPEMDIRLAACDNTPFKTGSFDCIIACMAYHHFPNRAGFAKEAARLLKKGGRLYIADPRLHHPIRNIINKVLLKHKIIGKFYTSDEIIENFAPFGFSVVKVKKDAYAQIVVLERK